MATGLLDANGIWNYGEDDNIALFSDLLNLGTESTSDAFTVDRARIATVENNMEATSTFVAASATARDAHWGTPTTGAAQILLQNKGARTVRTDTGYTEQYHGVYNATTNTGGRTTAGWYPVPQTTGLTPIRPTTATFVTGSGSVNSVGTVSFNGVSSVSLNGVFTSAFSHYRVIVTGALTASSSALLNLRLRAAAVDASSTGYRYAGTDRFLNSASAVTSSLIGAWAGTSFNCGTFAESGYSLIVDILNPAAAVVTQMQGTSTGSSVAGGWSHTWGAEGQHSAASSYDGFSLIPASLLVSGTVTVYGYNN